MVKIGTVGTVVVEKSFCSGFRSSGSPVGRQASASTGTRGQTDSIPSARGSCEGRSKNKPSLAVVFGGRSGTVVKTPAFGFLLRLRKSELQASRKHV